MRQGADRRRIAVGHQGRHRPRRRDRRRRRSSSSRSPTAHGASPTTTRRCSRRFARNARRVGIGAAFIHALYLLNLASENPDFYEKSATALRRTAETASAIGAEGVCFHTGSHLGGGLEGSLDQIAAALEPALDACSGRRGYLIENTAGGGGTIGRSVDELVTIFDRLDRHPRLGLCLDSCHLYASGYDITDRGSSTGCWRRSTNDRARPAALPPHQRLEGAARVEPRPARRRARRADGRAPRRLHRPPAASGPAGGDRDGRHRPGTGRSGRPDVARATCSWTMSATTCASTRKAGSPTGSSENSGLTHPSAPAGARSTTRPPPCTSAAAAASPAPHRSPRASARLPAGGGGRSRTHRPSACSRGTCGRTPRTRRRTSTPARGTPPGRRPSRSGRRSGCTEPRPAAGAEGCRARWGAAACLIVAIR